MPGIREQIENGNKYKYNKLTKEFLDEAMYTVTHPMLHDKYKIPSEELSKIAKLYESRDPEIYELYKQLCEQYERLPFVSGTSGRNYKIDTLG